MGTAYIVILCLILFLMIAMLVAVVLMKNARRLKVRREQLESGPVFALISDLHVGILPIDVRDIIERVQDSGAEFLLIAGDLCNRVEETGLACSLVGLLSEGLGIPVFIVLGNHDDEIFTERGDDGKRKNTFTALRKEFISGLESSGHNVHVLDNECAKFRNVLIGGLRDNKSNNSDIDALIDEWGTLAEEEKRDFILLTHNADVYLKMRGDAPKRPIIAVSGHTHGGQINLPFNIEFMLLKRDVLPKRKIYYGRHEFRGLPLYISSGVGCSTLPMRLGSSPEIVIFSKDFN